MSLLIRVANSFFPLPPLKCKCSGFSVYHIPLQLQTPLLSLRRKVKVFLGHVRSANGTDHREDQDDEEMLICAFADHTRGELRYVTGILVGDTNRVMIMESGSDYKV